MEVFSCTLCPNSADYGDGWTRPSGEEQYSRRHTLEFSEAECDHPSTLKQGMEPLEQLKANLEVGKIHEANKMFTTAL